MTDEVVDTTTQTTAEAATVADTAAQDTASTDATTAQPSALEALKASFAAKLQFIEDGIAALGSEAESELVALAEKYL
ncbi:Ig domain protein group 1 domain protein [Mangrovibacter sp. SLW1]